MTVRASIPLLALAGCVEKRSLEPLRALEFGDKDRDFAWRDQLLQFLRPR